MDAILYTAAAVYCFYLATSLAVIVLRFKEPDVERPYRVTGYPFTTISLSAACGFLIVAIPLVFLHALVASSSRRVVEVLEERATGMVARRVEGSDAGD